LPDLPGAVFQRVVGRTRVPALQGDLDLAQHGYGVNRHGVSSAARR